MIIDTEDKAKICKDLSNDELIEKLTLLEDFSNYAVEGAFWTYLKDLADDVHDILTEISTRFKRGDDLQARILKTAIYFEVAFTLPDEVSPLKKGRTRLTFD
jgi:hypothetical protein